MGPQHHNRNRAYYRHHRRRVIKRKMKITKGWIISHGYLAKGKIHCSFYTFSNTAGYSIPQLKKNHFVAMLLQRYVL
ncbi:hypothetical protein ACIQ4I_17960 [Rummeliibacillus sp. NPDC094406]|uniref:hypothetical protein n=1 Tax=Rummeliibacillus sp. NPDC094406 TaxID=3364511 RepID=UPI0038081592